MVSGVPDSSAMICCVRSATVTASSVGSAHVSSYELVCSDCAPPSTAASAWIATRATLLRGCRDAGRLRVRPEPHRLRLLGPEPLLHEPRPEAPCRPELGDLLEEVVVDVEEEREPRREAVDVQAARAGRLDVAEPVGQGERELLHRRSPRL